LYLLHGVWLDEDNPTEDLISLSAAFDEAIVETVDAVHGGASIGHRYGRAYGDYTTDVSPWIVGWVIGREISPFEVLQTNELHAELSTFTGDAFEVLAGEPSEVWAVERLDLLVSYEREVYGSQRPVSMSSWPTLDPMTHPTEAYLRHEDIAELDFNVMSAVEAPAGWFATYHAYPYYPDFISEDPDYGTYVDDWGPNSYLGYLFDLKNHYADVPVIIGEFGTPSSWGNAHFSHSGMNHGGLDEQTQAEQAERMILNIHESSMAGGMYFSWMDEWWKRTWITDNLDFPWERRRLWHNVTAPEQNFGLVGFDLSEPTFQRWVATPGIGEVTSVAVDVDEAYVHVQISLSAPLADELVVGFDTYRADLGELTLPNGARGTLRHEFAVTLFDGVAQLYATEAYDSFAIWHGLAGDEQLFRSIPTDGRPWSEVRWLNNDAHASDDGVYVFDDAIHEVGQLRVAGGAMSSLDAVQVDEDEVRLRLPWTLLHVTDPSTGQVLHDDRATSVRETMTTDGLAVAVSLNGALVETPRNTWEAWEVAPSTIEREKPGLSAFGTTASSLGAGGAR